MSWNPVIFLESLDDRRLLEAYKLLQAVATANPDPASHEHQLAVYLQTQAREWMSGVEPTPESEMSLEPEPETGLHIN